MIGDEGIAALSTCTALSVLRLAGCERITDKGVGALQGPAASAVMKSWLASNAPASRFFEAGLPIPIKKAVALPLLRVLDISACSGLTDYTLIMVGQECPQLGALAASQCRMFTDLGLAGLSRGCNRLRRIALSHCPAITDKGVKSLINFCPKLAAVSCVRLSARLLSLRLKPRTQNPLQINMPYCSKVSDKSGKKLSQLLNLRYLNLSGSSITTETLARLPKGVRILHLADAILLTDEAVDYVIDQCPSIEVGP